MAMVAEPSGRWVYAVAEHVGAACLEGVAGVGGAPVRAISAAGLAAVVGDVPLPEFGEAGLRRNLEDLDWLEATARAHHRVVAAVAEHVPVIPMQLATVYVGDASVQALLTDRAADLRAALGRTSGRQEWGVKAYAVRPAGPGGGPDPAASEPESPAAGSGAAYLRRRRTELAAQQDARRDALASAEVVHGELARLAADNRLHPPQAAQLSGATAQMLLNAAYLLDDERGSDFTATVAELAGQHPSVRLELTGPWPPYSFAGPREENGQA
jgi:Gas vesicle synthesis protein GvpL/GvpF